MGNDTGSPLDSPEGSDESVHDEDFDYEDEGEFETDLDRTVIRLRTPSTYETKGQVLQQYSSTDVRERGGEFIFNENKDPELEDVPFKLTWAQSVNLKYTRKTIAKWKEMQRLRSKLVEALHISYYLTGVRRYQMKTEESIYLFKKKRKARFSENIAHFTHWVTLSQLMVYLCSIATFGLGSYGFGVSETTEKVKMPNMRSHRRTHYEAQNPWIGTTQNALILLGARYPPCMRKEHEFDQERKWRQAEELDSACCILHSKEGCFQSVEEDCNDTNAMFWYSWGKGQSHGPGFATKGSVCGQDPRYCKDHNSLDPDKAWSHDITEWPICKEPVSTNSTVTKLQHMALRRQAFPCCLGLRGRCIITSWEHCDLLKGVIHDEAALCSQIDCFRDMCGMHSFIKKGAPDQAYRLITTLMIPEGLVPLLFAMWFQVYIMQDLERVFGLRLVAFLYLGCGIVANLAGAVMNPLRLKCGPSASHCAVLAFLQGIIFWHRADIKDPKQVYIPMLTLCGVIIFLGLFPIADFWGNMWGFLLGYLYTAVRLPPAMKNLHKHEGAKIDAKQRVAQIIALILLPAIPILYGLCFWLFPFGEIDILNIFDCLPFTSTFCNPVDPELGKDGVANSTRLGLETAAIGY